MIDGLVDSLVALHAVDAAAVGLDHLSRGSDFFTRQLQLFDQLWETNRACTIPAMDHARRWLHANRPAQRGSTPMHVDYRHGNLMYAADGSGTIAAVLDWELFGIGDPLLDVGYLVSTFTESEDPKGPLLELASVLRGGGFPGRAYVANRYAEKSGRDLDDLRWYVAFTYWRTAIGLDGFYKRSLHGTIDDAFVRDHEDGNRVRRARPLGRRRKFLAPSRLVGLRRAQELLLDNRVLDAETVLDWGLVNRVVSGRSCWSAHSTRRAATRRGQSPILGI